MNNILSGTCWGERQEDEIQIAPWLTPEWKELDRKIYVAAEAWESAGRARERRKNRRARQHRVNQWQGLIFSIGIFAFCAFAEWLIR